MMWTIVIKIPPYRNCVKNGSDGTIGCQVGILVSICHHMWAKDQNGVKFGK